LTQECLSRFTNPKFIHKFLKDMYKSNETDIVAQICKACINSVKNITELRKERKPIVMEIDKLMKDIEEGKKKKTKLS